MLVVTVWTWNASRHSLRADLQTAMDGRIGGTEQMLQDRLRSYDQILRGGVGLFQGSDLVTAQDWKNYLASYDLPNNYPSVQAIGYVDIIKESEKEAEASRLADLGVPNLNIYPEDPSRDQHAVVIYLEPQPTEAYRRVIGFDMTSDPTRRAAMDRARDTNLATISGRILPAQQVRAQPLAGFNMYLPHYDITEPSTTPAERQNAIRGFAYAGFRAGIFFKGSISARDMNNYGMRITVDGTQNDMPLYQSDNFNKLAKRSGALVVTRPLRLYGQTWNIEYAFNRTGLVSRAQLNRPYGVLIFGTFIALSIALIVWLLLRARARELWIQKEHDIELAKDELLSLASHQLRTPATGVKQYLGMVLQGFAGDVSPEQKPLLEKAYASNDRQLQVINEILHLAKIDAGRIVLARQETNLGELLQDIINEQEPDIKNADHRLSVRLPKRPITVNVDAHMLRMAIENILSNAIKYTPQRGRIGIHLKKDRVNAHIIISDNGVGIAEDDFAKLFKQFSRLPNEMSQRVGGTGVGLYLAKHLVELHGGSVNVRSQVGQGATFTITLPLREKE